MVNVISTLLLPSKCKKKQFSLAQNKLRFLQNLDVISLLFFGYLSLLHYFFNPFVLFHQVPDERGFKPHNNGGFITIFAIYFAKVFFFICKLWQFRNDYIIVSIVSFWLLIALANRTTKKRKRKKTKEKKNSIRTKLQSKSI